MKLRFKEQQYQTDATKAVVDCFLGQSKQTRKDTISRGVSDNRMVFEEIAFSNSPIEISNEEILENVKNVQKEQKLPIQEKLAGRDFTIEMETGTGKTYVYTKTMYELSKKYGWNKFIIMVPSIAIREGVNKSLQITEDHFYEIYGKKIRFFIYDNKNKNNIPNIRNFATNSSINVMIMNYQAFTSRSEEGRRIYMKLDELESMKPIDLIKTTNPILIIDEPQKLGKQAYESIKKFNSLFRLRYSATHKKGEEYNKVYRLDAVDAYDQKLVKKIGVKGIETKNDAGTNSYLFLDKINISKEKYPIAKIELEINQASGTPKKTLKNFKEGDNLYELSNSSQQYEGYIVNKIDGHENVVSFINGVKLKVGQVNGTVDEKHIRRIQIREAIKSHLEKEKELFNLGIKNLSLFFIDEVAKYRKYDDDNNPSLGDYAEIFEEEYKNIVNEHRDLFNEDYRNYLDKFEAKQVHNGYFSIDKKGKLVDSKIKRGEESSSDVGAYDLIMKNKERLLDFEEPTRFIFSHSALKEGWDNPNIFQICTLKQAQSDIGRRQEIGRGLRICVNKDGERMDSELLESVFFDINKLTVIASESYENFAKNLQKEIADSLSDRPMKLSMQLLLEHSFADKDNNDKKLTERDAIKILNHLDDNKYVDENYYITSKAIEDIENEIISLPEEVNNLKESFIKLIKDVYNAHQFSATSNERENNVSLKINKNFKKKEFQELWNKIKIKTVYEVDFNSEELIEKSVNHINNDLKVRKPKAVITYGEQSNEFSQDKAKRGASFMREKVSTEEMNISLESSIKYDLVAEIIKETNLTRKSIVKILKKIKESSFIQYYLNPEDFIGQITRIINEQKATTVINCITYHKTDQEYDDSVFTENITDGSLGKNIIEVKKHIYDYLKYDSENEKRFAENLEIGEVLVYAKLPGGFKIPTPIGNYNPDWAIVIDKEDCKYVYFIAETKGSLKSMDLRGGEREKIEYAKKHFKSLNESNLKYDVVDSYENLMEKIMR